MRRVRERQRERARVRRVRREGDETHYILDMVVPVFWERVFL